MVFKSGLKKTPDRETLNGFVKAGKTIDWISEKWNVTPQTVRAWFSKFNLNLPKRETMKMGYSRKPKVEKRDCPVCQDGQNVNYIVGEKHWFCLKCETEFDQDNVIYVYDDKGDLVELIADEPGIWEQLNIGKSRKSLIRTITV